MRYLSWYSDIFVGIHGMKFHEWDVSGMTQRSLTQQDIPKIYRVSSFAKSEFLSPLIHQFILLAC